MRKTNDLNGAGDAKGDFQIAAQQMAPEPKRKAPPPISVRLTEEERARLEQAASGTSLSAHIRQPDYPRISAMSPGAPDIRFLSSKRRRCGWRGTRCNFNKA